MNQFDACLAVARIRERLRTGHGPRPATLTLGAWFDECFLPSIPTPGGRRTHRSRFNAHLRPALGHRRVGDLTAAEVAAAVAAARPAARGGRQPETLSVATRNRIVALAKVICRRLFELGLVETNLGQGLRPGRERNQRTRVLLVEEEGRFFSALAKAAPLVQLLVELLLCTGMRVGEALQCRWTQVDLAAKVIRLTSATKSGRPRTVPLSEVALDVVRRLQERRRGVYLFPGRGDRPMGRPGRAFKAVLRAAEIDDLWIHDLRRTFATRVAAYLPVHGVSALLGHSSLQVTARYLVASDEGLHAAVDRVGAALAHRFPPDAAGGADPDVR